MITRIDLAKKDHAEVRKTPKLYEAFRKYFGEDRQFIPDTRGCTPCHFERFFDAWKEYTIFSRDVLNEVNGIIAK